MKKFLILGALIACSMAVGAQVQVDSLNRLVLGTPYVLPLDSIAVKQSIGIGGGLPSTIPNTTIDPDTRLCVIGKGYFGDGGYMTFGNEKDVLVGSYNVLSTSNNPYLRLRGKSGIRFESGRGVAATYFDTSNKFKFNCDVTVDGVFVNSDARLKDNIEELDGSYSGLSGICGYKYTLTRGAETAAKANAQSEGEEAVRDVAADGHSRYGFLAQEVKKVFPELVTEDENGYLSVDYIGFIPLLVDAYNELMVKVEEQEAVIAQLTQQKKRGDNPAALGGEATLAQNRPNPFSATTVIECYLPSTVADASVYVYDLQGKQLLHLPVADRGNTSVTVEARQLGAGMYVYALIADGSEIDSKRMIITE